MPPVSILPSTGTLINISSSTNNNFSKFIFTSLLPLFFTIPLQNQENAINFFLLRIALLQEREEKKTPKFTEKYNFRNWLKLNYKDPLHHKWNLLTFKYIVNRVQCFKPFYFHFFNVLHHVRLYLDHHTLILKTFKIQWFFFMAEHLRIGTVRLWNFNSQTNRAQYTVAFDFQ